MKQKIKKSIYYLFCFARFAMRKIPFTGKVSRLIRHKFQPYPLDLWIILKKNNRITWYEVKKLLSDYSKSTISEMDPLDLFDTEWYINKYHLKAEINPLKHYLYSGWELGYDPSPMFSTQTYFELNDCSTGKSPLLQYYWKKIFDEPVRKTFSGEFAYNSKRERENNNIEKLNSNNLGFKNFDNLKNKNIIVILDSIFGEVETTLVNVIDQDIDLDHIYVVSKNSYNFKNLFKNKVSLFGLALDELLRAVGNSNTNFLILYSGQKLPKDYFQKGLDIMSKSKTNLIAPKNIFLDQKVSIGNVISDTGISTAKVIEKDIARNIDKMNYLPNIGGVILKNFDEKIISDWKMKWFPQGNGEFIYFASHIQNEKVIILHDQYVINDFKVDGHKINEYDFIGYGIGEDYLSQQISIKDIANDKYRDYVRQPILIVVKDETFNILCKINMKFMSSISKLGFKLIDMNVANQDILNRLDDKNDGLLVFNTPDFNIKATTPNFSGKNLMFFKSNHLCMDECAHDGELKFKEISVYNHDYNHNRHYYAKFFEILSGDSNSKLLTFSNVFLKTWTQLGLIPPNRNFMTIESQE